MRRIPVIQGEDGNFHWVVAGGRNHTAHCQCRAKASIRRRVVLRTPDHVDCDKCRSAAGFPKAERFVVWVLTAREGWEPYGVPEPDDDGAETFTDIYNAVVVASKLVGGENDRAGIAVLPEGLRPDGG